MKWLNDPLISREGETRIVKKFILFPKTLKNETRCLESAYILETVMKCDVGGHDEWGCYKHFWIPIKFIAESELQTMVDKVQKINMGQLKYEEI